MVVVDTGSRDDTVQQAQAAGARVEQQSWPVISHPPAMQPWSW